MKISIKNAFGIFVISTSALLINSCIDPLYDASKGIDTEISFGGDSLALPIGSTDTIRLGDFLSSDDVAFLETMEDGGYGLTISDSLTLEDILKDLDVDKLKFADQVFNQSTTVSFGDISVSDFVIPGFTKNQTLNMNIPTVEIGDIVPAVNLNQDFTVNFSDFALDESKLVIDDLNLNTGKNDFLADVSPFSAYTTNINPEFTFTLTDPIDIGNLSVTINYQIEVPEGITNIYEITLDQITAAKLEIELALGGVADALNTGTFTPNITIDPTNLFKFSPLAPLTGGNIVFNNSDQLNDFNTHSTVKTLNIDAFHNLPGASNKLIDISKIVNVTGNLTAAGEVKANKVQQAKQIDLIINVKVKDVKIKSMDFDIPTFTTTLNGSSTFDINNNDVPAEINVINSVYFGKTAGSTLPTNMVINIKPSNLPVMTTSSYKIDNLDITFPNNFIFTGMAGQTYSTTNAILHPVNGFTVELNLEEINLSSAPITNGNLSWSGNISYSGQISINGRMDSKNINGASDPVVSLQSESAIKLNSANVTTNQINETIQSSDVALAFDIDIADQVARLGVINVKPGCYLRIDITKPTLPLALKGDNIILQFSSLYEFQPNPNMQNNAFTINGDIPDFIQLELKALHINQDLVDGTLALKDTFSISGGVILQPGTLSSTAIEALGNETLSFLATVSDMGIESTSIQMKTLEAAFKDSTVLDMEINDIPSEIVSLDSILLKDGAEINLEIAITNMPNLGANPLNAEITLKFPDLLKFVPGAVNSKNELVINQAFVNGKLSKKVGLKGLQFDGSNLNGKLTIDDLVGFDVNVSVVDPTINSEDLTGEDITVSVKVTLAGLEFKSVYGKFNVDFGDQMNIPNLPLSDLPDFLKGEGMVLDIANPVLSLSTESNIGIPVDTELSLTKFKGGNALTDEKITINFSLPKSNSPSEFVKTAFWYSPSESGMPAGFTFVDKNIQDLFKPIPDSIKIDFVPTINTGYQHFIDLMANYKLKVKYDIIIPFSFGKDLSIALRDTINDVNLDLGELNLNTGGLEIMAKIINSIPLNLELELLFTDADFNIIAAPASQVILAGAPDGSGVQSNIKIRLADNLEELKNLNKVILVFKATSDATIAGTPIKPSNFIKAELKARVLGGIKVKL